MQKVECARCGNLVDDFVTLQRKGQWQNKQLCLICYEREFGSKQEGKTKRAERIDG